MKIYVVKSLAAVGLRNNVKVLAGEAPVTQNFENETSADGFHESAIEAVNVTKKLVGTRYNARTVK